MRRRARRTADIRAHRWPSRSLARILPNSQRIPRRRQQLARASLLLRPPTAPICTHARRLPLEARRGVPMLRLNERNEVGLPGRGVVVIVVVVLHDQCALVLQPDDCDAIPVVVRL